MLINLLTVLIALSSMSPDRHDFTETFQPGQQVDLSQGFYICGRPDVRGVMNRLMEVADSARRHEIAAQLGCAITQSGNHSQPATILLEQDSACIDKKSSGLTWCEREAHQLLVRQGDSPPQRVLWISMDWDVD